MGVYGHLSFDVVSAAKVVRLNLLIRGGGSTTETVFFPVRCCPMNPPIKGI